VGASSSTLSASRPVTGLVRAGGRVDEMVAFDESVVQFFVEAAALLGVPKSLAGIYGICFASAEPLSFSDLQERLELSAGSISQGVKVLREMGALKTVRSEQDRRDLFAPDLELRKLVDRWLTERLQRQLTSSDGQLQMIAKAVPPQRGTGTKLLRDRIKHLQNWHSKASTVLPVVRTFLKLTPG
jgi:DNA-binding transcriptional regulator GbsR (MarR family)